MLKKIVSYDINIYRKNIQIFESKDGGKKC